LARSHFGHATIENVRICHLELSGTGRDGLGERSFFESHFLGKISQLRFEMTADH